MYNLPLARRVIYFALPLVIGLALLWVPIRDAIETGVPEAETIDISVPEGSNWIAFVIEDDGVVPVEGTRVAIVAEDGRTAEGEVTAESNLLLFELEAIEDVEEVTITWPDERVQRFSNAATGEVHVLGYPANINSALGAQWRVRGANYRFWGYVGIGILATLFALRVLFWAEAERRSQHAG